MTLRRVLQLTLAVVVASVTLALGTAAGAVDNPDYSSSPPSSQVTNVLPADMDQAKAPAATPATSSGLALTGADLAQFAVIGGVLVVGGLTTLAVRRRTA